MSTTIDERVVEMRFDNKHFESNVATSMSTLEKLKQKLKFDGASKGLEDINAAAGKVNMSGLGSGVDAVKAKFSALDVVAVTALANITNKAVDAGEKLVKSLSVDQITSGWDKYAQKTTSVQTLVNSTGKSLDEINGYLDKLMWYSDETSYGFTDMTSALATMTSSGGDIEKLIPMIEGVANATAFAGKGASEFSTVMRYGINQAYSMGYMLTKDWMSIENATVNSKQLIQALIAAGEEIGTIEKGAVTLENFRTSLADKWLTTEVMETGFGQFSKVTEEIYEGIENGTFKNYADGLEQIGDKYGEVALRAAASSQEAKTFTEAIDATKDAVSSGWMNTFELIFGDYEKAKVLWTDLAETLYEVFAAGGEIRNWILEIALNFTKPWNKIMEKLEGSGFGKVKDLVENFENVTDSVKTAAEKLEYFQDIVNKVWRGDYNNAGDNPDRFDLLEKAGYNSDVIQELVNKGYQYELTIEDVEAAHKKFGLTMETTTEETKKTVDATNEATSAFENLTDEQLEQAGLTEEEIALYKALRKEADRLGISVSELAEEMSTNDGRTLLIDSFKNLGSILLDTGTAIKNAWKEIFNPPGAEEFAVRLYGIIKSFNSFTEKLRLTDKETGELNETGKKLQRTFKGIFAIVDILTTVLGGGLKIAFKVLKSVLSAFDLDILDVTAAIGDVLVKFHEWFESIFDISGVLNAIAPRIQKVAAAIKNWFKSFKESEGIKKVTEYIKGLSVSIKDWWASLKDSEDLPKTIAEGIVNVFKSIPKIISTIFSNIWKAIKGGFSGININPLGGFISGIQKGLKIAGQTIVELGKILLEKVNGFLTAHGFKEISANAITGLVNGLKDGASNAWDAAVEMAKNLVQKVKDFLGIHSPSTVFAAIGGFIIAGLVMGLQNGIPDSLGAIKDVFQPMLDWIGTLDLESIFAAVLSIGTIGTTYKLSGALENLTAPVVGLGEIFSGVGKVLTKSAGSIAKVIKNTAKVVKSFSKVLNAIAFDIKAEGITKLGETLLMLVGAIIILTFFEPAELWNAVGLVAALAAVLVGLSFAMSKINDSSVGISRNGLNIKSMSTGLIGITAAILLMAVAVKMIGSLNSDQAEQGFLGLAGIVVAIGVVVAAFGLLVKGKTAENADKFGKTMIKMAVVLLLMAVVVKILGKMDQGTLIQGGIAMIAFAGIMVGLMAATKLISGSKNVDTIGSTLLKIALAIGVMALVANLLGSMDPGELIQGGIAIIAFSGIMVGLMAATKLINGSKNVDAIGSTLFKIALAIGVMALVAKLLGGMDRDELIQGGIAIVAFSAIIVGLMAATKLISGSKNVDKIGTSLLAISGAIAIMALVAFLLSMVSWEGFAKGTIMITAFAGIMVGLMAVTKLISGSKNVDTICKTILAVSGAIAIMALVAFLLSMVSWEGFAKGTIMITAFAGIMVGLMAATKLISGSKNVDTIGKTILAVSGAIAILAGIAVLLSLVPTENLVKGITVVAILAAIIAGLIAVTSLAKNCVGNLIVLTVMIAVLAGAVYLLSTIPAESAITSAVIIGSLMVVMTAVLAALAIIGNFASNALLGVVALLAMAVPLLAFVGVLALMQNVQNATTNVLALTILATAMTLLLIPLTVVGALIPMALLGVVALLAMAVPLLAFVGVLALMSGIQNGMTNALALAMLMTAIGDVLFKISLVAPLAVVGVAALTAMVGLMTVLGLVATAIGALVTEFPQLQTFLDVGIPILVQLASGLGSIIGSFISALAGEIMTILPQLGLCLSQFMLNATPFIVGAKMVDESVLAGVGILAGAVLALTAAELISGVASFLTGGSSFADLGTQLSQFMINALPFIITAATITPEMLSGVKALAETILIITAADILQGLTSFITGGSSLENFAAQLPILGQGLVAFSTSLGTFTEDQLATVNCAADAVKTLAQASSEIPNTGGLLAQIVGENDLGAFAAQFPVLGSGLAEFLSSVGTFSDEQVATVNCAAQAIKSLAEASSEIPNSGGWLGQIVGENDLGTFADQFPNLGAGLRGFLDNVGTFTDEQVATVNCAAEAVKTLASAASEIPNSGGWIGAIVGENDLGTFADQFPKLGTGLRDFLTNVGTFTDEQMATVDCAANAVKILASVASEIPNEGGWISKIIGDNDLGTFASHFPELGEGLAGFVSKLGTFDEGRLSTVNVAMRALIAITDLANANLEDAVDYISDFGEDLPDFAEDLRDFCSNMPDSAATTTATANLNRILSAVKNIGDVNSGALSTFGDNLKKIGTKAVDSFVKAFTSDSTKTDLKDAATKLGDQVIDGIKAKEKAIKTAGTNAAKKAVDGAGTQEDDMETAGKDLGKGLVKGIEAKWDAAYNAGYTLGQKAVKGEKDGQASNSPSKLTIQAGKWLGEGLIIGLNRMGKSVYNAGESMGKSAVTATRSAMTTVLEALNSDMDAQPTIRPVVDLSDVETGASAIRGLLGSTQTVGVRSNLNAIGVSMNSKLQNGTNDDIISAINKLNAGLEKNRGDTYNFGDFTYDDGSNITDAVQTLVRAARMGRRV